MKRIGWTLVLVLFMTGLAFAVQDGEAAKGISADWTTYAGLAGITLVVIGALKMAFPKFVKGKEKIGSLVVPVVLGILSKVLGFGFQDIQWATHAVALVGAAIGAGLGHDKVTNPLLELVGNMGKKSKKTEDEK